MLKRVFSVLKVVEERKNFKIFKIPPKTHKQDFLKTEEFKENPQPISASKTPYTFTNPKVGDKKYFWCTCGLSQKQPFCDSSHMNTSFKPMGFVIQEQVKQVALCMCKKTSTAPYCDHKACGYLEKDQN